jgi:hypothetical protein
MRGKYEHQRLKNQNLGNKISDKILFGIDLNKPSKPDLTGVSGQNKY